MLTRRSTLPGVVLPAGWNEALAWFGHDENANPTAAALTGGFPGCFFGVGERYCAVLVGTAF